MRHECTRVRANRATFFRSVQKRETVHRLLAVRENAAITVFIFAMLALDVLAFVILLAK